MEYKLNCIKCQKKYNTDDPDPYLCVDCNKTRLEIAKEVDKKLAMHPKRKVMSDLQKFDAIAKERGGGCHVRISDLGITL